MKRKKLMRGIAMSLLALAMTAVFSGCGREQRQGATDIPHQASDRGVMPNTTGNIHGLGNHYSAQDGAVLPAPGPYNTPMAPYRGAAEGTNLEISQEIANVVEAMDGIKSANVFVAGRTAFVGCGLHPGAGDASAGSPETNGPTANSPTTADATDQMKAQIVAKVKAMNPNIDNVYVSANPDFAQRMNVYAQDVKNGKPVAGFIKEFYTAVERIFPYQAGTPAQ